MYSLYVKTEECRCLKSGWEIMCLGILWVVRISLRCGLDDGRRAFKEMWYGCWSFFPRLLKCIVIHPDSCCIVKLLHTVVENRTWRYTFARDTWKEIMKNNLMSCYKYSHWDPFMDVNPKYHWQGIRLSLSASLLFEAAWKIQCLSRVFDVIHDDLPSMMWLWMLRSPLMWLNIVNIWL